MSRLALRGAEASDLSAIVDLFRGASAEGSTAVAVSYPRWDSATEIRSELDAYGATLARTVFVLAAAGGGVDGVTGLLGGPEDDSAYVIGPILRTSTDETGDQASVLAALETLAGERNIARLRASVPAGAELRLRALALRGFARTGIAVEMVRTKDALPLPPISRPSTLVVETLDRTAPAAWYDRLASLLSAELDWREDAAKRLRDYVEDGPAYRVRVALRRGNEPCGVAITWSSTPDDAQFGRIEYLAVSPNARSRGVGELLMRDALARLGAIDVYLQVDEWRAPAIRLYERLAFTRRQTAVALEKHIEKFSAKEGT